MKLSMHKSQYSPELLEPMRDELRHVGFKELKTADEVDRFFSSSTKTTLLVINSVCGCAAGAARPGAALSLQHPKRPQELITVFAGQDKEATEQARSYLAGHPPSSPCFALFKGSTLLEVIPRREIEGHSAEEVSQRLCEVYESCCRDEYSGR